MVGDTQSTMTRVDPQKPRGRYLMLLRCSTMLLKTTEGSGATARRNTTAKQMYN